MTAALQHVALALAAAVLDSLWQGALIAGAVWLGLLCLPRLGASTRYAIWLCALLALVLTPVLTVVAGGRGWWVRTPTGTTSTTAPASLSGAPATRPGFAAKARRGSRASGSAAPQARDLPAQPPTAPGDAAAALQRPAQVEISTDAALAIALAWLLAVCARSLLLLADLRDVISIRRRARPCSTAYPYPVLQSDRVRVPVAIGFARPAVVLPADLVARLDADALDAVVVHEIAHLRRYDVWTNAIARMAQALLALNPAAWFVMRRLTVEREIACDDWVVARTGAGETLAQTLLAMATGASRRVPMTAPSAFGSRHAVVERIERLLDARPRALRLSPVALGGALMALALIALVVGSVAPVLAYAPVHQRPVQAAVATPAGACAVPNRSLEISYALAGGHRAARPRRLTFALPSVPDAVAHYGAANVATVDLTVDARGKTSKVVVIAAPPYPGMARRVARVLKSATYEPALRNCVPVVATVRAGVPIRKPEQHTVSVIVPLYRAGWSAAHASSCKIPTVTHARYRAGFVPGTAYARMLPAFPGAMNGVGVDEKYRTTVRVRVNASGAATDAAIVRSAGRAVFDEATLAAARTATYPLTTTTCEPLPDEYVWTTTFETQAFP